MEGLGRGCKSQIVRPEVVLECLALLVSSSIWSTPCHLPTAPEGFLSVHYKRSWALERWHSTPQEEAFCLRHFGVIRLEWQEFYSAIASLGLNANFWFRCNMPHQAPWWAAGLYLWISPAWFVSGHADSCGMGHVLWPEVRGAEIESCRRLLLATLPWESQLEPRNANGKPSLTARLRNSRWCVWKCFMNYKVFFILKEMLVISPKTWGSLTIFLEAMVLRIHLYILHQWWCVIFCHSLRG